jgi:hypothetical protein
MQAHPAFPLKKQFLIIVKQNLGTPLELLAWLSTSMSRTFLPRCAKPAASEIEVGLTNAAFL